MGIKTDAVEEGQKAIEAFHGVGHVWRKKHVESSLAAPNESPGPSLTMASMAMRARFSWFRVIGLRSMSDYGVEAPFGHTSGDGILLGWALQLGRFALRYRRQR
jgi:hypothetical protein